MSQSQAGGREVAHRLFATEYDDADFSYSESDEERAPNYVITPAGARVNRVFVVGVLTEVEPVSDDVLRARVVDPTGAFVLYAGQYQPDEQAFLESVETPTFVAVTGKARTFQPDDSDQVFTSIRPESINEVDAETRDHWTVQAAEQTLERVGHAAVACALRSADVDLGAELRARGVRDSLAVGLPLALEHYGTTPAYLDSLRDVALDAARVVAGELDEVEATTLAPDADGSVTPSDLVAGVELDPITDPISVTADDASATASAVSDDPAEDVECTTGDTGGVETDDPGTTASTADEPAVVDSTPTTEPESAADSTGVEAESAPTTETATAAEPTDDEGPHSEPTDDGGPHSEPKDDEEPHSEPADGEETHSEPADDESPASPAESIQSPDSDSEAAPGEDLEDFDSEFELDEEEREEIESAYGTDFQTGTEVDAPGEADIDTPEETTPPVEGAERSDETAANTRPEPDQPTEATDSSAAGASADAETTEDMSTAATEADQRTAGDDDTATDEAAETDEADLQAAVLDLMEELDDGDGAERAALISAVVDRHGTDTAAVEDAIEDALMEGKCYEPDGETLKSI